jgi:hypothetical protein
MSNQSVPSTDSITVSFSGSLVLDGKVLASLLQPTRDSTTDQAERPASVGIPASPDSLPRLAYSMAETATILGVSYVTVHRLVQRRLLRSSLALRTKLIPKTEIERFLKSTLSD